MEVRVPAVLGNYSVKSTSKLPARLRMAHLTSSRTQNMLMTGRETATDAAFAYSEEADVASSVVLEPSSGRC